MSRTLHNRNSDAHNNGHCILHLSYGYLYVSSLLSSLSSIIVMTLVVNNMSRSYNDAMAWNFAFSKSGKTPRVSAAGTRAGHTSAVINSHTLRHRCAMNYGAMMTVTMMHYC